MKQYSIDCSLLKYFVVHSNCPIDGFKTTEKKYVLEEKLYPGTLPAMLYIGL